MARKKKKQAKRNMLDMLLEMPEIYSSPFTVSEVIEKLSPGSPSALGMKTHFELDSELFNSPSFIDIYDEERDSEEYYYLPGFFKDAEFLVEPRREELDEQILFPGHRFMPFVDKTIHPSSIRLRWRGEDLPMKKVKRRYEDLFIYHSLLGESGIMQYLLEDDQANIPDFTSGEIVTPSELTLSVFDMSSFYTETGFQAGDGIKMKVEDFSEGLLSLSRQPPARTRAEKSKIRKWSALFGEGIQKAINDNGVDQIIEDELAVAFLLNRDYLLKNPVLHVGGFLEISDDYALKSSDGETWIWDVDSEPEPTEIEMDFDDVSPEDLNFEELEQMRISEGPPDSKSLDSLLDYMGFDLCEEELKAYILDELYRDGKSADKVIRRCLDDRVKALPEFAEFANVLYGHIYDLWEDVADSYDMKRERKYAEIRARALSIRDENIAWLRGISEKISHPSQLPPELVELSRASRHIADIIVYFNYADDTPTKKEHKNMLAMAERLSTVMSQMRSEIEDIMGI